MSRNSFFAELKRRNVIRMAGLYLVAAWLVTQVSGTLLPGFDAPPWVFRAIVMLLAVGFVPAMVFAWVYEITPEGIKREAEVERDESITPQTGRRMDRAIIVVLALALAVFAVDRFVLAPRREARAVADAVEQARATSATSASNTVAVAKPDAAIPEIDSDPSIAVLPLSDLSQAHDQAYFSDGISEDMLNLLAKVPKLRVIARTSSFSFKGKDTPIADIARALNVAALLEGSVRKAGDTVRISVELIRAKDSSQLWSQTYDRKFEDIFKIQDEIAAAVVDQLRVKLLGAVPTAKPVDPKVYPLILQAHELLNQQGAAARKEAIAALRKALEVAPDEARAWAELSRAYFNQMVFYEIGVKEGSAAIREAANKALASDPRNLLALSILARLAADVERDFPAAARYYQRVFEFEPGYLGALNGAGLMLANIKRTDEALTVLEYRVAHDPKNPTAYNSLGGAQYVARRWDAAIASLRMAISLSPEFPSVRSSISAALLLGKHDAAGALKECEAEAHGANRDSCMALALAALKRTQEADAALAAFIDKYGNDQPVTIATVYAYRGDPDAAFTWLGRAVTSNDPFLSSVPNDPMLDLISADPRWLPFLRSIGYASEQLAKVEFRVTLPQ